MDEHEPLDPEIRLLYCVCSTVPHRVLVTAQRLHEAAPADPLSVLLLIRRALEHIIEDLDRAGGADCNYFYGHNDLSRFEQQRLEVVEAIGALSPQTRSTSRFSDYLTMARLISAERLAAAILDFEAMQSGD